MLLRSDSRGDGAGSLFAMVQYSWVVAEDDV